MAAYPERPGLSQFLYWPVYLRQCRRLSSLCFTVRCWRFWTKNAGVHKFNRRGNLGNFTHAMSRRQFGRRASASVLTERYFHRNFRCSSSGEIDDNESGLWSVRARQMAGAVELYSELWIAMGSTDISETGDSAIANSVCIDIEKYTFPI